MSTPTFKDQRSERVARFNFSPKVAEKATNATRCFIAGLGPSLAKIDPDVFEDEFVIGVNYILRTKFKPDVLCISDPSRIDTEHLKPGCPKVVTVKHVYRQNIEVFDAIDTYHDINFIDAGSKKRNAGNMPGFHPTFSEIYWAASVIAELAVPLATYLGIKEIYVLGLDGARASFPTTHVWGSDPSLRGPHDSTLFHLHECVANAAKRHGTTVNNATLGGVVEAFNKVDLNLVKPLAVRRDFAGNIEDGIVVWKGNLCRLVPNKETVRIQETRGDRYLRHKAGKIQLDKDDGTDAFEADSSWIVEPSFVNEEWVSFRSKNLPDTYITSVTGTDTYRVRSLRDVFSPYFSSFRIFESAIHAQSRVDADRMLQSIEHQRELLGNMMVRADKL